MNENIYIHIYIADMGIYPASCKGAMSGYTYTMFVRGLRMAKNGGKREGDGTAQ